MKFPFWLVDVFGERPFSGNQLCVVTDATGLDADQMQTIACEIGFSETTFVLAAEGSGYSMRILTPGGELPFAGHPTLGTAFVLVTEQRVTSPVTQRVGAGEFRVEVDLETHSASVEQHAPDIGPALSELGPVAAAAGLSPRDLDRDLPARVVSTGLPHLMVPAASVSAVAHARPDLRALAHLVEEVGADGYYLFAPTAEGAKARLFDPSLPVAEDPATALPQGPLPRTCSPKGSAPDRSSSGKVTRWAGRACFTPTRNWTAIGGGSPWVAMSGSWGKACSTSARDSAWLQPGWVGRKTGPSHGSPVQVAETTACQAPTRHGEKATALQVVPTPQASPASLC